jgi:hypothetical protein
MQVETFECTETAAEPIEAAEEAISLMESLGLQGQMELVKPKSGSEPARRSPYREMTAEEFFVYSTICPERIALEKYKASPIPLRVLQIASHVKSLGICKRLEVWDKVSHAVQDPVLVGIVPDASYDWMDRQRLILARWGEVLETFSVLFKRAAVSRRESLIQQAMSISKQAEAATDAELMQHTAVSW